MLMHVNLQYCGFICSFTRMMYSSGMVHELFQWQDFDVKLSQAFSPATAISRSDLFHGRRAIIRRLIDDVNQAGQHAIIYGERGVGKTSVANVLSDFLQPFTSETIVSARVNCYGETTYRQIWESLFREVELPTKEEFSPFTVNDVVDTLRRDEDRKLIFIIDEFDRTQDPDIDTMFADTIKALSDFNVDTTLIVVGVADDVDDLIEEHQSVDRGLVQVHLPRMPMAELMEIVKFGISAAGMEVTDEAASQICTISLGLPHYAHALGLAAGRAAIDEEELLVETRHVSGAIKTFVAESQQTILHQFDLATASPRRENFYFKVLTACALAPSDDLGCFRAADLRAAYSHIMGRDMQIPSYGRHLHGLSEEDRGAVLQRLGRPPSISVQVFQPADAALRADAGVAARTA